MKAIVYEKYGPPEVLKFAEIPKPIVKNDEVLIKVHAASVTPLDWHLMTGTPYIARLIAGLLKSKRYDLIFDVVPKRPFSDCSDALKPQGIYVTTEFSPTLVIQSQWVSRTGDKKLIPLPMRRPSQQDFLELKELLETGKITPVIDRRYPLNEVPDAPRYIGKGHACGKIVIMI